MASDDGRTTDQLFLSGYLLEPGQQWMRLDSTWKSQCRRCLRWFGETHKGHWCPDCYAHFHGWHGGESSPGQQRRRSGRELQFELWRLFASTALAAFAVWVFLAGLRFQSFVLYTLSALFLLAALATMLRRGVEMAARLVEALDQL